MEKTNRLLHNFEQEVNRLERLEQTFYNNKSDVNYDDVDYRIIKALKFSLKRIIHGT